MIVFELGTTAFGLFLAYLTYEEGADNKPTDWQSWGSFSLCIGAQVSLWAVTIKSFVS